MAYESLNEFIKEYDGKWGPPPDDWENRFPELGWDENRDLPLEEFVEMMDSGGDNEDDDEETLSLQKAEDILLSVKAIILEDFDAEDDDLEEHRFLILEDAYSDFWDLPGGHLEDDELLEEGLEREIEEETGLQLEGFKELFIRQLTLGDETKPVMFYFVKSSGKLELSEEHTDYSWVTLEEIDEYNLGVFADVIEDAFEVLYDDSRSDWGDTLDDSDMDEYNGEEDESDLDEEEEGDNDPNHSERRP